MLKFPVAGGVPWVGSCGRPPVMVPMVVSTTESKLSKSTAPGTELVVAPMVTEMAFAGVTASTHPATTSTALSFDFISNRPSRQTTAAATSMAFTEFPRQLFGGASFFGQPKAARRVDSVPLGTPPGDRIKAFVMADASQYFRVQAKLRELIERASSAADANVHRGIKPCPLGFAVRPNGSKFAFEPKNIEDNDAVVALIRTLFLQHNVVCYVLTLGAVSEGKQYVLFSAEDESGPMVVGHREVIMRPAPHLGPLEIIDSNFAEGRFVGLLPRQATPGMQ
jgi:hypothetical protein